MNKAFLLVSVFTPALFASQQGEARLSAPSELRERTGLATLYALDPLSRTLCLEDGKPGGTFQNNEPKNRCSDIDFNTYNPGFITVGIEGSRLGQIIDLGTSDDLMRKYGYQETVGKGQGFASLRVEGRTVVILKDRKTGAVQELQEGRTFLAESRKQAAAAVRLGHIYLVRLTDSQDKEFSLAAKLIVVDYRHNESVTFRWVQL